MLSKVAAHVYDFGKKCWRVHLRCGHVVITSTDEHTRKIKGRFCPSCPNADRALMADLRNEEAEKALRHEALTSEAITRACERLP